MNPILLLGLSLTCVPPKPAPDLLTAVVDAARDYACQVTEASFRAYGRELTAEVLEGPTFLNPDSVAAIGKAAGFDWNPNELPSMIRGRVVFAPNNLTVIVRPDDPDKHVKDFGVYVNLQSLTRMDAGFEVITAITLTDFRHRTSGLCTTIVRFSFEETQEGWQKSGRKTLVYC